MSSFIAFIVDELLELWSYIYRSEKIIARFGSSQNATKCFVLVCFEQWKNVALDGSFRKCLVNYYVLKRRCLFIERPLRRSATT